MQTPFPTLFLIALYLAVVKFGPRIMKNRQPFEMKPLLFVFNSAIVGLYVYLTKEVTIYCVFVPSLPPSPHTHKVLNDIHRELSTL